MVLVSPNLAEDLLNHQIVKMYLILVSFDIYSLSVFTRGILETPSSKLSKMNWLVHSSKLSVFLKTTEMI